MRTPLAALIALPLMASVVFADPSSRAVFQPASKDEVIEPVGRASSGTVKIGEAVLSPAEIEDVDVNRDGEISFAELLLHDLKPGF